MGRPRPTHDTLIERCIAARVNADTHAQGFYTLNGFTLGHGSGNRCIGSVAVGVAGGKTASGFNWPSQAPADGMNGAWLFEDCTAHNNRYNGIYAWQNDPLLGHVVTRFVAYRNGGGDQDRRLRQQLPLPGLPLIQNGASELEIHAQCRDQANSVPPRFVRIEMDHGGRDWCVQTFEHLVHGPAAPVLIKECTFTNYKSGAFHMSSRRQAGWFLLKDCTYSGNEFWFEPTVPADTIVDVDDQKHGSIRLRRFDQGNGTLVAAWNARSVPLT